MSSGDTRLRYMTQNDVSNTKRRAQQCSMRAAAVQMNGYSCNAFPPADAAAALQPLQK
jgi:hypothetical protein